MKYQVTAPGPGNCTRRCSHASAGDGRPARRPSSGDPRKRTTPGAQRASSGTSTRFPARSRNLSSGGTIDLPRTKPNRSTTGVPSARTRSASSTAGGRNERTVSWPHLRSTPQRAANPTPRKPARTTEGTRPDGLCMARDSFFLPCSIVHCPLQRRSSRGLHNGRWTTDNCLRLGELAVLDLVLRRDLADLEDDFAVVGFERHLHRVLDAVHLL